MATVAKLDVAVTANTADFDKAMNASAHRMGQFSNSTRKMYMDLRRESLGMTDLMQVALGGTGVLLALQGITAGLQEAGRLQYDVATGAMSWAAATAGVAVNIAKSIPLMSIAANFAEEIWRFEHGAAMWEAEFASEARIAADVAATRNAELAKQVAMTKDLSTLLESSAKAQRLGEAAEMGPAVLARQQAWEKYWETLKKISAMRDKIYSTELNYSAQERAAIESRVRAVRDLAQAELQRGIAAAAAAAADPFKMFTTDMPDKIQQVIRALEQEVETVGMSRNEVRLWTLEMEGANEAQMEWARGLIKSIEAKEKLKDISEKPGRRNVGTFGTFGTFANISVKNIQALGNLNDPQTKQIDLLTRLLVSSNLIKDNIARALQGVGLK